MEENKEIEQAIENGIIVSGILEVLEDFELISLL